MAHIVSIVVLTVVMVPAIFGLFVLFRNEIEISEKVTGGYGVPVILGFMLVYVVMPVVIFLAS